LTLKAPGRIGDDVRGAGTTTANVYCEGQT
jgi:hypothetical protein